MLTHLPVCGACAGNCIGGNRTFPGVAFGWGPSARLYSYCHSFSMDLADSFGLELEFVADADKRRAIVES